MNGLVAIATIEGVLIVETRGEGWEVARRGLSGHRITALAVQGETLLAGATDGIFRSDDHGKSWRPVKAGPAEEHIRSLAYHPEVSGLVFAGTEPAAIFVSHDNGEHWREAPEVSRLRDELEWSLPYSPEAGAVRDFAFQGQRGYAAVEQGGLLRTEDQGGDWRLVEGTSGRPGLQPAEGQIHPDVHSVEIHPESADVVLAATGGGLYRTEDGGVTWTELYDDYVRALWIDELKPDHLLLGPANGVDRGGRIEESLEAGKTWAPAARGTDAPWPHYMVESFVEVGEMLVAVLSNGELLVTPLREIDWRHILADEVDTANDVVAMAW